MARQSECIRVIVAVDACLAQTLAGSTCSAAVTIACVQCRTALCSVLLHCTSAVYGSLVSMHCWMIGCVQHRALSMNQSIEPSLNALLTAQYLQRNTHAGVKPAGRSSIVCRRRILVRPCGDTRYPIVSMPNPTTESGSKVLEPPRDLQRGITEGAHLWVTQPVDCTEPFHAYTSNSHSSPRQLSDSLWPAGLAHFLEHMLFMGTEKYPEESEYGRLLSPYFGT